jgi:hypothetical protein
MFNVQRIGASPTSKVQRGKGALKFTVQCSEFRGNKLVIARSGEGDEDDAAISVPETAE